MPAGVNVILYTTLPAFLFMEELKKKLKSYKKEQIVFTPHVKLKLMGREINEEIVCVHLLNPTRLIDFEEQKSKRLCERKYKLIFELSGTRYLVIVATVNKYINVITVFIRYRKWRHEKKTGGR